MDGMAFLVAVVSFVMALVALNKISRLQTALFKLRQEIEALKRSAPVADPAAALPEAASAVPAAAASPAPPEAAVPAGPMPPRSIAWGGPAAAPGDSPRPASGPRPPRDMEQALAGRWFVWIGGVAIAVGGLLFAKYAYDNGLIPPALQVLLGLAAGLALAAAGEWLRRRSPARDGQGPDHVPAALAAAGLAVLFGTLYAGYALYHLYSPLAGFLGLAAVGLGGLGLSRRQGPFIAALGLLGSYIAPALIASPEPSAWGFFPYLLTILAAALLTLRGRNWWWLGHGAIAGVLVWSVLWLNGPFAAADSLPVGLAAWFTGLAAMLLPAGRAMLRDDARGQPRAFSLQSGTGVGVAGLGAAVAILVLLVLRTDHASLTLWLLAAGLALLVLFAWLKQGLRHLAPAAALVMLGVLASWREVAFHARTLDEFGRWSWSNAIGPEAERYLHWMIGSGSAFMLAGIAGVLVRPHKRVWGALGGGAAFLFLFGAWARADFMLAELSWAMLAAATAAILLGATLWWSRRAAGEDQGAGLLALAAAALLVMALARLLDGIWLTLAIAALGACFAGLSGPLKPRLMGPVTTGLAGLAALRLFASRELWRDEQGLPWGEHWVLYGYGLPALLFWVASRLLRRTAHEHSAVALEGISLGLMIALAALETRVLIAGGIGYERPQFLEMAAHVLTWAGAAYGLMHRQRLFSAVASLWGARLLLVLAAAGAVGLNLLALNPVMTGDPVPGGPFFNALLLAYLAPVPLILLIARRLDVIGWERFRPAALGLALVLLFVWVTLETKRLFQGMVLTAWPQSLDENYAYSAVWLILALALFVTGIRLGRQQVRLAGLGVLALVVLKVFLGDMSNLEGLLRIASFVGLGFCLVGIGWLYQHFVRGTNAAAAPHGE